MTSSALPLLMAGAPVLYMLSGFADNLAPGPEGPEGTERGDGSDPWAIPWGAGEGFITVTGTLHANTA